VQQPLKLQQKLRLEGKEKEKKSFFCSSPSKRLLYFCFVRLYTILDGLGKTSFIILLKKASEIESLIRFFTPKIATFYFDTRFEHEFPF